MEENQTTDTEIQHWFADHGKVTGATPVADPQNKGAQLIEYTFEDGAKVTIRPAFSGTDDQGKPFTTPQEIVARALPTTEKEGATGGPKTGPTREVYRSGQWVTEPNPLYQQGATTVSAPPDQPNIVRSKPGGGTEGIPKPKRTEKTT